MSSYPSTLPKVIPDISSSTMLSLPKNDKEICMPHVSQFFRVASTHGQITVFYHNE